MQAPAQFSWSSLSPITNVKTAEARLAEARGRADDALTWADAARAALRLALDAKAAADAAEASARAALADATARRGAAEGAWSSSQAPELWPAVEAARSVEAQAHVRARQSAAAAALAAGEAKIAARRVEEVEGQARVAADDVRRAEDELAGARSIAREVDAAEARRVGEEQRRHEALVAKGAAFAAKVEGTAAPIVARYLVALGEVRAAEEELERVLPELAAEGRRLAREFEHINTVPAQFNLLAGATQLLANAAWQHFRAAPWGKAASAKVRGPAASGGAFDDVIAAARRLVGATAQQSAAPMKRAG